MRNLFGLIALSGRKGKQLVALGILLTAGAAVVDTASLALLRRTLGGSGIAGDAGLRTAVAFLLAALAGSVLRLIAQRQTVEAQYQVNRALALRAFRTLQSQDYADYLRRGASEGFAAFERLQLVSYYGIGPLISGASALLGAAVILLGILVLYPAGAGLIALAVAAVGVETVWRSRSAVQGALSGLAQERSVLLYEARTAFRHIFLANGQERMCEDFAHAESHYRLEQSRMMLASQSSRHTIEIAGLLAALGVLGIHALRPLPGTDLVPLLAVTALATLRLLPQVAAVRSAFRLIAMHAEVSSDVRELLKRPSGFAPPPAEPVKLLHRFELANVVLARPDRPITLDGLDLLIERGARIGIRGESGIGKSSLLDVICGAIAPDRGTMQIDGVTLDQHNARAWRERIGVVSQNPVLLGATLREAIVFPQHLAEIDATRFDAALSAAGVGPMVKAFPRGLDTPVGEASSLLSGGQRQRLALAHALYRAQDLLVLDEATGQLDPHSEAAIVAAVAALPRDLTIIVASHRPAIFACCDLVYRLEAGRLVSDA